jgi:hypothetical protein
VAALFPASTARTVTYEKKLQLADANYQGKGKTPKLSLFLTKHYAMESRGTDPRFLGIGTSWK